jgi:hypothetical protein
MGTLDYNEMLNAYLMPRIFGIDWGSRDEEFEETNFKKHANVEFSLSGLPMVKEILPGAVKLNGEQIAQRVKEHLSTV